MSTVRNLSGNDISVYLSKQTAKGAIDSNPVFTKVRRTEGKARKNVSYVQSSEVKTDRQARQNVQDQIGYGAELSIEVTKQTIQYMIDAIQGTEATNIDLTDTDIAADANGFTDAAGNGFASLSVGDYIFVSGFADSTIDGTYRITVKNSDGDIETEPAPPATEAAGASVTIKSFKTTSASTIPYYTLQTRITDTSKAGSIDYRTFYDATFNNASFEIGESGIMTGAFNIVAEQQQSGTAQVSGQTDASEDTSEVLSNIGGVVRFWIDGSRDVCTIKSAGFEFSNNLQEDRAAGCEGAEYANGEITLSGALVARNPINNALAWRDRYEAGTNVAIAFELDHGGGDKTLIEIPQAVITEHEIADGSNVVANSEMTYTAEEGSNGYTCAIFRNWS